MYNSRDGFNAEKELQKVVPDADEVESKIIDLFLELPRERQKAILSELWSEFKPEPPKGLRNFRNLPY